MIAKTAPPKPSVKTQLVLEAIEASDNNKDERWDQLQESLDLLFAKVSTLNKNQHQIRAQLDLNSKVVDQSVRDQLVLVKQNAETGHVVAQLQLGKISEPILYEDSVSPKSASKAVDPVCRAHE